MRITSVAAATAIAAALAASLITPPGSAHAAADGHRTTARADWKAGAKVAAANQSHYWIEARDALVMDGNRFAHESADLKALIKIPETGTTAKERATAHRATSELNGFFRTPGLYGVPAKNARLIARADWIKSSKVSAADANKWIAGANDELNSYGKRFAQERHELTSLEAIPLTSTTHHQRAVAHRDVRALDAFFRTPGANS